MAVSSDKNEPTTRPRTPKWAPELTALLVPVVGPNRPIGIRISAPTRTPRTVAAAASQNDSPSRIGKVPKITVAKVFAPPNWMRNRSSDRECRCSGGMVSMPCCSTSVAFGLRTAGVPPRPASYCCWLVIGHPSFDGCRNASP